MKLLTLCGLVAANATFCQHSNVFSCLGDAACRWVTLSSANSCGGFDPQSTCTACDDDGTVAFFQAHIGEKCEYSGTVYYNDIAVTGPMCPQVPNRAYDVLSCSAQVCDVPDQLTCDGKAECAWFEAGVCSATVGSSCQQLSTETDCRGFACRWTTDSCGIGSCGPPANTCSQHSQRSACELDADCTFVGSGVGESCYLEPPPPACESSLDEATCLGNTACNWLQALTSVGPDVEWCSSCNPDVALLSSKLATTCNLGDLSFVIEIRGEACSAEVSASNLGAHLVCDVPPTVSSPTVSSPTSADIDGSPTVDIDGSPTVTNQVNGAVLIAPACLPVIAVLIVGLI